MAVLRLEPDQKGPGPVASIQDANGELGAALEGTEAGGWLLLFWVPAYILAIVGHEAGHAFTTKHYGREVPRVGIGWYWFGPVAYIATSDMWLEGPTCTRACS